MAKRRFRFAHNQIRNEARIERRSDWQRRSISVVVGPESGQGWRLDQYLPPALMSYSRTLIKRWLDQGFGRCNGRPAKPAQRVRAGDLIELVVPHPPTPPQHQTTPEQLAVLHEDDGILVCNKPVGQLAHPAGKVMTGTLLNQVQRLLHARGIDPDQARLVNRIDRDTSGIVLATWDADCHRALCEHLRRGDFAKEYLAICHGVPDERHGHWRDPIADPPARTTVARLIHPDGQPSHTEYEVIEAAHTGRYSLLRIQLHTGRQHQIRIHAAHHGHPLIGDWVYGAPCRELVGQALHAATLEFPHPRDGSIVHIEAPLIGQLEAIWEHLAAGGDVTPRDLDAGELRRLGDVAPPKYTPLPHGYHKPSWLDDDEFVELRAHTGE